MAKVKRTLFGIPYIGVLFVILVLILIVFFDNKISSFLIKPNLTIQPPVLQTKVVNFRPSIPPSSQEGSCFSSSVISSVSDAWRCTVGNEIYDPCIIGTDNKSLVCGADPSKDTVGFVLTLTSPLPKPEVPQETWNNAWMIELASGRTCSFAQGASGIVDNERINYYCESTDENNVVIIGDLKKGTLWNATRAVLAKDSTEVIQKGIVPLKTVWLIE